jgi:hypothetical protein
MAEIAVTVLEVDEIESGPPRPPGRLHEIVYQPSDFVVGQHRMIGGDMELAIQNRVAIEDHRLTTAVCVGSGEPAGVRQLQADQQIVGSAVMLAMLVDQRLTQRRQIGQRFLGDE